MGLTLHWPCVTEFMVYPPMGSMATDREMGLYYDGHKS